MTFELNLYQNRRGVSISSQFKDYTVSICGTFAKCRMNVCVGTNVQQSGEGEGKLCLVKGSFKHITTYLSNIEAILGAPLCSNHDETGLVISGSTLPSSGNGESFIQSIQEKVTRGEMTLQSGSDNICLTGPLLSRLGCMMQLIVLEQHALATANAGGAVVVASAPHPSPASPAVHSPGADHRINAIEEGSRNLVHIYGGSNTAKEGRKESVHPHVSNDTTIMKQAAMTAKSWVDVEKLKSIAQTILIDGDTFASAKVNVNEVMDSKFLTRCCIETGSMIYVHKTELMQKLIRLDMYGTPYSIKCAFEMIHRRLYAEVVLVLVDRVERSSVSST